MTVQFFVKHSSTIWIPENSPAQDVHLNSVLGIDLWENGPLVTLAGRNLRFKHKYY